MARSDSNERLRALARERADPLRAALVPWFTRERRDLPWRRTRDPYGIWVSEAMLQQTRVETVVPYWTRFLERFPTVRDLAEADDEALLAAWSGLGYYRRARSLRAAAVRIVEEHAGEFPRDPDAALALPGVGPYTAGAVLSIAHGVRVPAVDGNVLRVFARWFRLRDPVGSSRLASAVTACAEELVPEDAPGDWNQAVMELGATLCSPRAPRCLGCPVAGACDAHATAEAERLPVKAPRPAPIDVRLEVLLVVEEGAVLVERRPPGGRMAGLWELPTRELPPPAGASDGPAETYLWPPTYAAPAAALTGEDPLASITHGITRHRIRVDVVPGALTEGRRGARLGEGRELVPRAALDERGLTGLTRKVLRHAGVRARLDDLVRDA